MMRCKKPRICKGGSAWGHRGRFQVGLSDQKLASLWWPDMLGRLEGGSEVKADVFSNMRG